MLHIGKYFNYVASGALGILFFPHQGKKYIKDKDKYSIHERYKFVKGKANKVLYKYLKAKLEVSGLENINNNDNYLFTPNHQGMLDPVALIDILDKPTIFVSKKETKKYPVIGKIIYMIDGIFLDRDSPRDALNMVKEAKKHLIEGKNVTIFPEGTRSKDEDVNISSYKAGAFKCAYGTGVKIVPIVIDKSYVLLSTKVKNTDKVIKIRFLQPISSEEYEKMNTSELAIMIENRAKEELKRMRDN